MKSIFNFRPLFVIFLACIVGAMYYIALTTLKNMWLGIFIAITVVIVICIIYIILGGLNLKGVFFNYLNKTYKVWLIFLTALFIFSGIFALNVKIKENTIIEIKNEVEYTGKIASVKQQDSMYVLELRNVKYYQNSSLHKLKSNLTLRVYSVAENENFKVGNIIKTTGLINKTDIKSYSYYNYSSLYFSRANLNDIVVTKANPNFIELLKIKSNEILTKYMGIENGNIAYAMIFGDKTGVDTFVSNIFSISGISHILAVSGLHIGVLVAVILFILKKLKCNNIATLSILCVILLLYMFICDFTPSVVRASIMAIVLTTAHIIGKRYDALSSLSLAGILIALFKPTSLLSVGFQLSFACVFAIITLSPFITNMLVKLKLNEKFAGTLSISTATSIALIPFCAHYFNRVSMFSILTNIVVIPIFSIVYVIMLPILLLSLILNFVGYLLVVPNILIHFIKLIANFVSTIKYSYFVVFDVSIFTFISILALQYVLEFMVGYPKLKVVVSLILFSTFIISLVFNCIPKTYKRDEILCFKQYYGNMVVINNENGENTLVGCNEKDFNRLNNFLIKNKVSKICNLVLYEEIDEKIVNEIVNCYKIKNVYMSNYIYNKDIQNVVKVEDDSIFKVGNVEYNFVVVNESVFGVNYSIENKNNFIANKLSKENALLISNNLGYNFNIITINELMFDIDLIFDYTLLVTQYNYFNNISIKLEKQDNFSYVF